MSATTVAQVREWVGDDGAPNGEWPYATQYVEYAVGGELAERIRERFGVGVDNEVTLTEARISGGYSEYTQEDYFEFEVSAGGETRRFDPSSRYYGQGTEEVRCLGDTNLLIELLNWLDGGE